MRCQFARIVASDGVRVAHLDDRVAGFTSRRTVRDGNDEERLPQRALFAIVLSAWRRRVVVPGEALYLTSGSDEQRLQNLLVEALHARGEQK